MGDHLELEERVDRWLKGQIDTSQLYGLSAPLAKSLAEYGYLLYEQGRFDTARVIFEALSVQNSSDPNTQKMLGSIYQIQGKWDAAYYHYSLCLSLSPNDIFVITNRGETLIQLQRPREAAEDLKRAIQLDADGTNPVGRRARILLMNLNNVQRWAPR
jgi:tetratricopeptide (TPR) repeat protein